MYASIKKLEDRITASLLNQRLAETGEARTRVLVSYLESASAVVDAYICSRYVTPAPDSPVLEHITLSLALWQIEADRGSAFASDKIPPSVQIPYDEAMGMLSRISSGEMKLRGDGAPAELPGSTAGLDVVSPQRQFGSDSPGMEFF